MDFLSIESVLFYALLLHGFAVAVVNVTPTPTDDKWVGKFYKLIEIAAGLFGKKVKELPGEGELIEEEQKQ